MTMIRYLFLLAILAFPAFAAEAATAAVALAAPITAPPSMGASVVRMIGGLFVVIAVLMSGAWAFKNRERFVGARTRESKLKVLETRSLGSRHSICVVAYDQQRILLSTSPTGVTMLTHLPEASLEELEAEANAPALPTFSEAFVQALALRRK
jgi:flagellar biogenesis protein FliO